MKRLLFLFVVLAAVAASCKKTKGPSNVPSAHQDNGIDSLLSMKVSINGREWSTDSAYSYKVKNSDNDTTTFNLMVIATQIKGDTASTITFNITGYSGIREYVINPPQYTATYFANNHRYFATSGSFNVRADTGHVLSGTFNFIADSISATKGTFKIAIP